MPFIYKITNKINNKVYIGKTIRSLDVRFKEHLRDSAIKDSKLYRAIRKYGKENFSIELIEEVEEESLSERERFWIKENDSYYHGYNSTFGGEGESSVDEEQIIKLYNSGKTMKEIYKITSHTEKTISSVLKRNSQKIRENKDYNSPKLYNKVKIIASELKTSEKLEFQSMSDAARFLIDSNLTKSKSIKPVVNKISDACNKKSQSAYGFIWNKII